MRIRLEPDGDNKYKIILPGCNRNYPIGVVSRYPFKKSGWRLKSYFIILLKDDPVLNQVFDDSMKAARALATLYTKVEKLSGYRTSDAFDFMLPDDTATD
jgi:hypothetical protein